MSDLPSLKDYIDLGATFLLCIVLIWGWVKKLDKMEATLVKILSLLVMIVKSNTNFNHTSKVLGDDKLKVEELLGTKIK